MYKFTLDPKSDPDPPQRKIVDPDPPKVKRILTPAQYITHTPPFIIGLTEKLILESLKRAESVFQKINRLNPEEG